MSNKEHLPIIGVGPFIVIPQVLLTAFGIILTKLGFFAFGKVETFRYVFAAIGSAIVWFGIYLWCSANFKTKVDQYIIENKLATTGAYGIVRNPLYSAFLLCCFGALLINCNLALLFILPICWGYMTVFLKNTEEKWLFELYGQEYVEYCKRVNRSIPWFPKKQAHDSI